MSRGVFNLTTIFSGVSTSTSVPSAALSFSIPRAPGDALGFPVLSFSGVPAGTELRIYNSAGIELAGTESYVIGDTLTTPYIADPNPARFQFLAIGYEYLFFDLPIPRLDALIPVVMRKDRVYKNT
jgi:hypothetical protein